MCAPVTPQLGAAAGRDTPFWCSPSPLLRRPVLAGIVGQLAGTVDVKRQVGCVGVQLLHGRVLIIERLQPYRAHERLIRLHQDEGLAVAAVGKAAVKMDTRFDRKHFECVRIDAQVVERARLYDLYEVRSDDDDVAVAEFHADPQLRTGRLALAVSDAAADCIDNALDAHRLAGRHVYPATDFHVERIADFHALLAQRVDGILVGHRANQSVAELLVDYLLQQPGGRPGPVTVVPQYHLAFLHRLLGEADAFAVTHDLGVMKQLVTQAPGGPC